MLNGALKTFPVAPQKSRSLQPLVFPPSQTSIHSQNTVASLSIKSTHSKKHGEEEAKEFVHLPAFISKGPAARESDPQTDRGPVHLPLAAEERAWGGLEKASGVFTQELFYLYAHHGVSSSSQSIHTLWEINYLGSTHDVGENMGLSSLQTMGDKRGCSLGNSGGSQRDPERSCVALERGGRKENWPQNGREASAHKRIA